MWIILYLAIGVIETEFTSENDYTECTWSNFKKYIIEVIMWLPNLFLY